MISIRSGSGLGDAIYLQSIARHLNDEGHSVEACTDYPDVFRPLSGRVRVSPFRRSAISRVAHYAGRRHDAGTDQFQDCCIAAGVREAVELKLGWRIADPANAHVRKIEASRRPVIAVQLPRAPFGDRPDGYGRELLPEFRRLQDAIDVLAGQVTLVQIGAGEPAFSYGCVDIDLANRTSVTDLLDVASVVDGFLGYVSYMVPLAESLGKPGLFIWSRRGLQSRDRLIASIAPAKIFHGPHCEAVIDDCSDVRLRESAHALCERATRPVAA